MTPAAEQAPTAIVAAIVAATIGWGRFAANRLGSGAAGLLAAAAIVTAVPTAAVAIEQPSGLGLRFQHRLDSQHKGQPQHDSDHITFHQRILQTSKGQYSRRLPAPLSMQSGPAR
jgi:hypothetical protein